MKKIISSLLALSLIVGSFFNSMSLSALADSSIKVQNATETQAKSPQKALPLSPEGQGCLPKWQLADHSFRSCCHGLNTV